MNIPIEQRSWSDEDFFNLFGKEMAKSELVFYFRERTNVTPIYDLRNKDAKVDFETYPYAWQYLGGNSVKDYVKKAGALLLQNKYLLPHGLIYDLGENLENYPIASLEECRTLNQTPYIIFQRGFFLEILALYYQMTGKHEVVLKFREMLKKFFEVFSLTIEEFDIESNWFQYSKNRECLNVGFLGITFLNILNTSIVYEKEIETELVFQMIKTSTFIGLQFLRFNEDTYKAHNMHLFTRGVAPYVISTYLPEIKVFENLNKRSKEVISDHLRMDLSKTGKYSEHSIGYWLGATVSEMLAKVLIVSKLQKDNFFDKQSLENLHAIFDLAARISPPSDTFDVLGDQGGISVDSILNMGAMLFSNKTAIDVLKARNNENIDLPKYLLNSDAGFFSARNHFGKDGNFVLMSVKDNVHGCGHDHMDMLSLNVHIKGEAIFSEPYAAALYKKFVIGKPPRGYLYNMTSHNTVLAHGEPIVPDKYFEIGWSVFKSETHIEAYEEKDDSVYLKASHNGYCFAKVVRELSFSNSGEIIVKDTIPNGIKTEKPHIQRWNLATGVAMEKLGDNKYIFSKNKSKVMAEWTGDNIEIECHKPEFLVPQICSKDDLNYVIDVKFSVDNQKNPTLYTPSVTLKLTEIK